MTQGSAEDPLVVADLTAWRDWLVCHEDSSDGTWLTLAKRGSAGPTALVYQEALEEALCSGWIDGQRRSRDAHSFMQRFTPRRARSVWFKRNVDLIAQLEAEGRLRPRGRAEVERAQADGRWERAYSGAATAEIPERLTQALAENQRASAAFASLGKSERYTLLHPLLTAPSAETLAQRVDRLVTRLEHRS